MSKYIEMKKSEVATWNASIDVDCPYCGESQDLLGDSENGINFNIEVAETDTDRTTNIEVVCTCCEKEFIVPGLEW